MSRPSSANAEHSQPQSPPPSPDFPDLAELVALAETLQNSVKSLLAFCQQSQQAKSSGMVIDAQDAAPKSANLEPAPYESRCYQVPDFILEEEREMLDIYKAKDWKELFCKAYDQIYATVLLMEHFPADDEIDGFSITLIAENLMIPLQMLSRSCSLIADFHLVSVMKVAA